MSLNKFGEQLLKHLASKIKEHLLSENADSWKSGYLYAEDIKEIERQTNRKVRESYESGEIFYKLGEKIQ